MDFNKFASSGTSIPQQKLFTPAFSNNTKAHRVKNYDHFTDPYIRRYHLMKIAIKSLSLGLMTHILKNIVQNIGNRKFYKMSPWLQTVIIASAFTLQLSQKFDINIDQSKKGQMLALRMYKNQHLLNSQNYH